MSKHVISIDNQLQCVDIEQQKLQKHETRIRNIHIGVNFHDIDFKYGHIKGENLSLGCEAVGEVVEIHPSVHNVKKGDIVVYGNFLCGSYTQEKIIDSKKLIKVPNNIPLKDVAAVFYKGMVAHFLVTRTYKVSPKTIAFVTCAASGVGMLLTQMLHTLKVKVIGTVGSQDKVSIAKKNGCDLVLNYKEDKDFAKHVYEYTKGFGVDVVYDSLGGKYTNDFIQLLGPFGLLVNYGNLSGYDLKLDTERLRRENLFFTNPMVFRDNWDAKMLKLASSDLFMLLEKKYICANIGAEYAFKDIAEAHKLHENGQNIGSTIVNV